MGKGYLLITLKEFPNNCYVLLDEEFRSALFKTAWKKCGSREKFAKKLGVSETTMASWRRGRNSAHRPQFCSIQNLKVISAYLKQEQPKQFSMEEMQKHVMAYRAPAGRLWVCNPQVPVQDSVELRGVVTHLICDGSAPQTPQRTSRYASTSKTSIEEFISKLTTFGDILRNGNEPLHVQQEKGLTKGKKNKYVVGIPKVIPSILGQYFGISFGTFESRLPSQFFEGKRVLLASVVRAFLIDEGNIRDNRIYFTSANKRLLQDLKRICTLLEYSCGKLEKKTRTYSFCILTKSFLKAYADIIQLGKLPIPEKQKRLELGVRLVTQEKDLSKLNEDILTHLHQRPMTNVELSLSLGISAMTIWGRLKKLEKENKVLRKNGRVGKGGAIVYFCPC